MKDHRSALRYAQALFRLAEERRELEETHRSFFEAVELIETHPEISHLLRNTTLSREEKEDFLEKILPEGFSRLVLNFMKVLVKKRRFQEIRLMGEKFHRLYEAKKGVQRVRVEAPVALDETLQERLCQVLQRRLRREIHLEVEVNPAILGGLVLDFDGTQIDGSLRTALYELKQKLLVVPVR